MLNWNTFEVMRSLKQEEEKIICVSKSTIGKEEFFPEFKDSPNAGNAWSPDIEKILALKPDAVFLYATHFETSCDEVQKNVGGDYKIGGNGTALHQIIEMAGGKNIFGDISGYKVIDKEEVMLRDPEIIVKQ